MLATDEPALEKVETWGGTWPETMSIISWNLWKWRNAEVLNNEVVLKAWKIEIIKECVEETTRAWKGHYTGDEPTSEMNAISSCVE